MVTALEFVVPELVPGVIGQFVFWDETGNLFLVAVLCFGVPLRLPLEYIS